MAQDFWRWSGALFRRGRRERATRDAVELFLCGMFPDWEIKRDKHGVWRAIGRVHLTASDPYKLLDLLGVADPEAMRRIARIFDHIDQQAGSRRGNS